MIRRNGQYLTARVAELPPRPRVQGERAPTCALTGCRRRTSEGKPWCPEHVGQSGYVAGIMARVEVDRGIERGLGW